LSAARVVLWKDRAKTISGHWPVQVESWAWPRWLHYGDGPGNGLLPGGRRGGVFLARFGSR